MTIPVSQWEKARTGLAYLPFGIAIPLAAIAAERGRQTVKWGVQHHEDGTGSKELKASAMFAREACDEAHSVGLGTWADIFAEEFFEALAESDTAKLREELIHVAAVAVAWVEDIDSREATT